MEHNTNRRGNNIFRKLPYLFLALSIVAAAVCSAGIVLELRTRGQGHSYYSALSASKMPIAKDSSPQAGNAGGTKQENPSSLVAVQTEQEEPWEPYMDFEAMRGQTPDLTAWIRSEGTVIDYPIVQGSDNEHYLSHLPNGKKNAMGSIFIDYRNSADFSDKNTLIYGHYMKSGDMFATLKNYSDQSYYDDHSEIEIYTPEKNYTAVLFAGYLLDSTVEAPPMSFKDTASFENYISDIHRRSIFKSSVEVTSDDRLICLCTCAYDFKDARLVVVGKIVETEND